MGRFVELIGMAAGKMRGKARPVPLRCRASDVMEQMRLADAAGTDMEFTVRHAGRKHSVGCRCAGTDGTRAWHVDGTEYGAGDDFRRNAFIGSQRFINVSEIEVLRHGGSGDPRELPLLAERELK